MASHTPLTNPLQTGELSKMLHSKKTVLQIKVRNTQLQKELKALKKSEEMDLRFQQTKELQFRMKYEKYLTRGNFETSLRQKAGFKRAAQQSCPSNISLAEHVPLHKLIYTNGEVDIEKVMCLHLLSVHYVNIDSYSEKRSLTLFPKRSKPNMLEASALPFYIVEIIYQVDTELKLEFNEREDVIILVNTNLEKLIISILEVLAIVSPLKLQQLKELSLNKKAIQEIMTKMKISNFLAQVKDSPVLFKIENYRLEIAQFQREPSLAPNILSVCCINVKDKSKKFEIIQTEIRNKVNSIVGEDTTSGESWSMFHRKFCNCKKASSRLSFTSSNAIALLNEDGREFAVVTATSCHLPSGSSVFCPSLTAIIKSCPKQQTNNIAEEVSGFSLHTRAPTIFKNEQNKIISSLLHKVNNSHRILIGKKAAEFKSQNLDKGKFGRQKTPIKKIMENVFSKQSLMSFASTTENEELKLLFQPCCKGGMGIGSFILEPDHAESNHHALSSFAKSSWQYADEVVPKIMKQEKSIMNTALIKQDIFTSETRNKIKQFLLNENPGNKMALPYSSY